MISLCSIMPKRNLEFRKETIKRTCSLKGDRASSISFISRFFLFTVSCSNLLLCSDKLESVIDCCIQKMNAVSECIPFVESDSKDLSSPCHDCGTLKRLFKTKEEIYVSDEFFFSAFVYCS